MEKHLQNLRQLTFSGENAEAYFFPRRQKAQPASNDGGGRCDQIYRLDVPQPGAAAQTSAGELWQRSPHLRLLFPRRKPHHLFVDAAPGDGCPPEPDRSKGYVWPLYNYQIYSSLPDGSDVKRLSNTASYDAESTICKDGSVIHVRPRR
ncbi:MAG: hypothetical protein U0787_05190 [Polyangia bacterium]